MDTMKPISGLPWMKVDESWGSPPAEALGALFQLTCPVCSDDYNHFGKAVQINGNDYWGGAWMGRGAVRKLGFWCESGHYWNLCFGFHKGNVYVYAEPAEDERPLLNGTSHEG
jgi:hypothetical protein